MKKEFTYEEIHKILWKLGYSYSDIKKILADEICNREKLSEYKKPETK